MSLLLKAFPHGRPRPRAPRALLVLSLTLSMALLALPMGEMAQAQTPNQTAAQTPAQTKHHAKKKPAHHKSAKAKARKKAKPPRVPGQPPRNYVIPTGSLFSYPNRGRKYQTTIRNRVLYTIQSTWGGPLDRYGAPLPTNGRIRIVTWSFDDWTIARALVAAKKRGVSVQVIGAKKANIGHASWRWLRQKLGENLYRPKLPNTNYTWSFARQCRGACRGRYGTAHAKYFLFDNVASGHARKVTVQTSMNLTTFAVSGQWNEATVWHSGLVYDDYYGIFRQARLNRPQVQPYSAKALGTAVVDYFFPRYGITPAGDPVYQALAPITCYGATAGGTGATRINIIQYAIYGSRGEWIARRLRQLWEHGCSVSIIYSVASRPVLQILRNGSGRGAIPMRQSVITDGYGTIVKYNHSKWMTIVGHWGRQRDAYVTFDGSANWANLAAGSDEQMQRVLGRNEALRHLITFTTTWNQPSSHLPGYGVLPNITGRVIPTFARDVPQGEPEWGKGVFKYMTPD